MFWKFNLMSTSQIDTILDGPDVTLYTLLDQEDILQECKAQNRKLISFLVKEENIKELVRLITEEPPEDIEEKKRFKYPNTACELLTSDVPAINEALAETEENIQKLYDFLDSETTLNPLLASFFSKVMGLLIARKSEMTLEFLKNRDDFVGVLLKHIGTSAIMDLLLRLLTCIDSLDVKKAMIEWLNKKNLVQRLIACLTPEYDEDIHSNAAQSLTDIIRLGREQIVNQQDNAELLTAVEQEENIQQLLDNMLTSQRCESVIVNGLSVIQTLLEFKKQGLTTYTFYSPEDSGEQMQTVDPEQLSHGVNSVLTAICPRLKDFHAILLEPPKQMFSDMPTTVGPLTPPLGNTRLQISRLIATLLLTNKPSINTELAQLGTISVLLDLYFSFIWNNFLHAHVTQCLYTILNNPPLEVEGAKHCPLLSQLFLECKMVERILNEWESNDQQQGSGGGRRKGFMGHLTRIANDVVHAQESGENAEAIKSIVSELPEQLKERWVTFLSGALADTNKKNQIQLVQGHNLASSSEDDDADFSNIPFPQDTAMQQAFSDYQLQQMTSNFIDQFGFNEDEFGEQEEKTDSPFTDKISSIDFSNVNEDLSRTDATKFEQYCNERLEQFDNDSDEDIWEEKEITFSPNAQQKQRSERLPVASGSSNDSDNSTESEEELDSPERIVQQPTTPAEKMDIDSNEAWTANFEQQSAPAVGAEGGPIAMDTSPWDSADKPAPEDNWADFSKSAPGQPMSDAKWAEFSNKMSDKARQKQEWADFTSFDDEKKSGNLERSSSPVDMDTTEPTSRINISSANSPKKDDLVLESIDADLGTDVDTLVEKASGTAVDDNKLNGNETLSQPSMAVGLTEERMSSVNNDVDVDVACAADVKTTKGSTTCKNDSASQSSAPHSETTVSSSPDSGVVNEASPVLVESSEASGLAAPVQSHRGDVHETTASSQTPADSQAHGDGVLSKTSIVKPVPEEPLENGPKEEHQPEKQRCLDKDVLEAATIPVTCDSVANGPV
ncbi:serine/threonine-protein phosphatase 6 regulatory subunit 3-like isoform X2 [Dreissena polymorpha]|uniref:serine/threonine-protein phosphatase 6 regulatory subunit 3-like isoform X2 n=1 Tax=Dreissena polymorpha TaxID=45954 RepID=UPI0022642C88|nr:serine/threonine-protein phosphatase 6 regulatory subunit 3-like isoform X2 [Dreissena polymorpha]